jgi:hypothetical protein
MKQDKLLMKLLKVSSIAHLLVRTNKGDLHKVLRDTDKDYHYTLDSVPVDKETAKELIKLYENI